MEFEDMINNIINCDCYEMIKNIPDNSIDLVYIDIPYLFADGGSSTSPLSQRIKKLKQNDLKGITKGIDYSILNEFIRISKNINCFIWCSKEQILDIMNLHTTQPNDIVLDCFCGSGTTCVAAKETGRRYIGMEINKEYYDIAKKRINGILANGQTTIFTDFDEEGK